MTGHMMSTGVRCGVVSLLVSATGLFGCSEASDPNERGESKLDRDIVKSITQPIYGGDTAIDNASTTGAVGASASILINGFPSCSGTLVTPTKVISAAHCFRCPDITNAALVSVTFAQNPSVFALAAPPVVHPQSDSTCTHADAFDMSVLTLATPVPASVATPQPVLLADPQTAITDNSLLQPCKLIGYGGNVNYNSGVGAGPRRAGTLVPEWYLDLCGDYCEGTCNNGNVTFWREDLNSNQAHGADGDSGGGLFCTINGAPALIGVHSGNSNFDSFCNSEHNAIQAPTGGPFARDFLIQQLAFPTVANTSSFAVLAKGAVLVNDRASVLNSSGNSGAMIGGGGGGRLGTDTRVGNTFVNGAIAVADRARVDVALTANGNVSLGNQVQGTFTEYRYSALPGWDLTVNYPTATASAVTLAQGERRTIGSEMANKVIPSVTVDQAANLTLACGTTYFINRLTLNAGGRISVDTSCGPARIFVRTSITNNYGEIVDITPGLGDILVGYTGTSALNLGAFHATIVAPRAKVTVLNGNVVLGAIFAQTVEIHQDSVVLHYPFNFAWGPT